MRYKVGDRVKIKGLDWYNANKNKNGDIDSIGEYPFSEEMQKLLGEHGIVVYLDEEDRSYSIATSVKDSVDYYFCDYMLEDVVEESCEYCSNSKDFEFEDGYSICIGAGRKLILENEHPICLSNEKVKYCFVCGKKLKND